MSDPNPVVVSSETIYKRADGTIFDAVTHAPIILSDQEVAILREIAGQGGGDRPLDPVEDLIEALRLTVEYVGTGMLPPIDGWSWFDALKRHRPELAQHFVEFHREHVVPYLEKP